MGSLGVLYSPTTPILQYSHQTHSNPARTPVPPTMGNPLNPDPKKPKEPKEDEPAPLALGMTAIKPEGWKHSRMSSTILRLEKYSLGPPSPGSRLSVST